MSDTVYRSQEPFTETPSAVLVISCSSNDFMPPTRDFLEHHLGLQPGAYDWLAVPGGGHFLLLSEYLPKFAWVGQKWVKFAVEKHGLRKVIVIAHEGCAWYDEERLVPAFLHSALESVMGSERQRHDLVKIVESLRQLVPAVAIEAYFAARDSSGHIAFSREAWLPPRPSRHVSSGFPRNRPAPFATCGARR
ncbi:MAG: hypothetical protein V1750_01975 [Acidobacteriota bacterium]